MGKVCTVTQFRLGEGGREGYQGGGPRTENRIMYAFYLLAQLHVHPPLWAHSSMDLPPLDKRGLKGGLQGGL